MKEQIKLAISRFSRFITEAESKAKELCDVKDLSSSQINYLETINELGNPSITELSQALGHGDTPRSFDLCRQGESKGKANPSLDWVAGRRFG